MFPLSFFCIPDFAHLWSVCVTPYHTRNDLLQGDTEKESRTKPFSASVQDSLDSRFKSETNWDATQKRAAHDIYGGKRKSGGRSILSQPNLGLISSTELLHQAVKTKIHTRKIRNKKHHVISSRHRCP